MEKGNYPTGPGSEFSKLVEYADTYDTYYEPIAAAVEMIAVEMKTVFLLEHTHEVDEDIGSWDTKTLGIYSTKKEVKQAIQFYKTVSGFKDYPEECFLVKKYKLDIKHWTKGFTAFED